MALVKYIDLEDNKLIDDQQHFVLQLINLRYNDLSYSCLNSIVNDITGCIYKERYNININIAEEHIARNERKFEEKKRLLSSLNQMELMKNPTIPVNIGGKTMSNIYYENLLVLFGHNELPITIQKLAKIYGFPLNYRHGNEGKITHITCSIFDIIKHATTRSLLLETEEDISKEEWTASASSDPKDKFTKKRAIEKLNILQARKLNISKPISKNSVTFNLEK